MNVRKLLTVVALFGFALPSVAADRRFDFKQIELDNGMKVISLEDFSCPIVAVQVWYHVGAKNENPKRQGFAHMFEHMMFRGTDRLNETSHFDNIRRVGGNTNAYTAFDQTVYVEEVPSEQLEMVLWLEAERMAFLKIDEKGFRTERKVVEEELRLRGLNTPYGQVPEKLLAKVYGDEPYGWTPGGQIEHLRASTIDELQAFWDRFYVPNNATLVVVGAVKHAQVQVLARKYFSWIPRCSDPIRPKLTPNRQTKPRTIKIPEEKGPLPIVGVMYRTVPQTHPDALPLEILMGVLGGGESSRLYVDAVKDQQIAQVALGAFIGLENDSLAAAGGVLLPFGDKVQLIKTIKKHITQLRDEPITEAELAKLRNQLRREVVDGSLTVASKAGLLGRYAVLEGDAERINRRLEDIEAVTVADVQRVAKKYLTKEHRLSVLVEPSVGGLLKGMFSGKKDDSKEMPELKEGENRVAARTGPKASAKRPADFPATPPQAALSAEFPDIPHTAKTLPNGLRVVVVSNREVPMVSMTLGIKSGAWTEHKPGVANLAMGMLTKGTKNHDAKDLARVLETNAVRLSGSAGMDTAQVTASALVPQLDLAVSLLADVVENPTFPKDELDILKKQTKMGLMVATRTPEYLADRQLRQTLYGDHPYARSATGELENVDAVTLDDMRSWWGEQVRPENAVMYLAGDVTPSEAFAVVEKHLGGWKVETPFKPTELPKISKPGATHIYLVDRPSSVQSQIRVGHLSVTRRDPGYFTARVLGNIFGGGFNSRLNKAIRVEKGLTYGARASFQPRRFVGQFVISTFTKTPSTAETVKAVLEEIEKIRSAAPTDEELDDTKTYIAGSFPGERETPEATVRDLWMIEAEQLPADYLQSYLQGVKATKTQDVAEAAKRLIHPDEMAIVVVGRAKDIQADLEAIAPVTVVNAQTPVQEPPNKPEID
jgi:zinc protease